MTPFQSAIDPAGPQAAHIAHLWWIFFWTCTAFYVAMIGFFVAAWIRGRRNPVPEVTAESERAHTTAVTAAR